MIFEMPFLGLWTSHCFFLTLGWYGLMCIISGMRGTTLLSLASSPSVLLLIIIFFPGLLWGLQLIIIRVGLILALRDCTTFWCWWFFPDGVFHLQWPFLPRISLNQIVIDINAGLGFGLVGGDYQFIPGHLLSIYIINPEFYWWSNYIMKDMT